MARKTPVVTEKKIKEGRYQLPELSACYHINSLGFESFNLTVNGQYINKASLHIFIKDLQEIYDVLED